ncbi:MAG: DUF4340 domain-containing protein [Ruminococcus sp.]|nr:DUF4340 domain-containing protein [Ruminococcus sp.]MCD7799613.1 DUF4340 domain-containing protein [Ruminococcus sp.]
MKFWKLAIILVVIIGVSAGAYFGISKSIENKEAEELASSGVGNFLKFDSEDINFVSYTSSDGTFELTSEDGSSWTCTNSDMRIDSDIVVYTIYAMCDLDTTKLVEEDSTDLSKYGLDNPISVTCSDGYDEYSIQIGNLSPSGESYYIKSPDNNDVYTISASEGSAIHITKNDLKNRLIIDSYNSDVNKIVYSEGDNVVFNCQKDESGVWTLVEPNISNIDTNIAKISSITDLLIRADVIDFITENPTEQELAEYGLDNPKYTIEIADSDEDNTIYLGNSPTDNVIYVQFADTKEVATFYMGEIGIIDADVSIILNDVVYNDKKENITNITYEYNGQTLDVDLEYDSDNRSYTYTKNGSIVTDEDEISELGILTDASLQISLYKMDLDATPTGEPSFTITFTRNYEPNIYKLEFIPTDEDTNYYYVVMNGDYFGCIVRNRILISENGVLKLLDSVLAST